MKKFRGILGDQKTIIEKTGAFNDTISITLEEITDEQLEQIVSKLNEVYETEITLSDDVVTIYNSNVRGRDIFSPFILISSIIYVITVAIITIMYWKKLGLVKTIAFSLGIPALLELIYFFISAVTKLEINSYTTGIVTILYLTSMGLIIKSLEEMKKRA